MNTTLQECKDQVADFLKSKSYTINNFVGITRVADLLVEFSTLWNKSLIEENEKLRDAAARYLQANNMLLDNNKESAMLNEINSLQMKEQELTKEVERLKKENESTRSNTTIKLKL
jgi:hypothetical protein